MAQVLSQLPKTNDKRVIVGPSTSDDAGVYELSSEVALVQTVDFFTPVVDDPYLFGKIAAVNSLSDVWAMGAEPITALSIAAFPIKTVGAELCTEILRGGAQILAEHGVALLGGHTVEDEQLKFGYAVTGIVHPKKVITNAGAKVGDALVLTKRLGTGIISSALKRKKASQEAIEAATASMLQPNKAVAKIMQQLQVNAATDITGFGLLGHAFQMAKASKVTLKIYSEKLLALPQVFELLADGIKTKADRTNSEYLGDAVEFAAKVDVLTRSLMLDPQTSGGMLVSLAKDKLEKFLTELHTAGVEATECGEVLPLEDKLLKVEYGKI